MSFLIDTHSNLSTMYQRVSASQNLKSRRGYATCPPLEAYTLPSTFLTLLPPQQFVKSLSSLQNTLGMLAVHPQW